MPKSALKHIDVESLVDRLPVDSRERWETYLQQEDDPAVFYQNTETWIHGLSTDELLCRGYGHMWDVGGSTVAQLNEGLIGHALTCLRCSTEKWEVFSVNSGLCIASKYVWPDSYKRPEDAIPVPRAAFRTAAQRKQKLVRNLKVEDLHEEFHSMIEHFMDENLELTDRQLSRCETY